MRSLTVLSSCTEEAGEGRVLGHVQLELADCANTMDSLDTTSRHLVCANTQSQGAVCGYSHRNVQLFVRHELGCEVRAVRGTGCERHVLRYGL